MGPSGALYHASDVTEGSRVHKVSTRLGYHSVVLGSESWIPKVHLLMKSPGIWPKPLKIPSIMAICNNSEPVATGDGLLR